MIKKEEVAYIAWLARIELSTEELVKFRTDLSKILGYIEILKTVNTEGIQPLAQVTGLENVLRDDSEQQSEISDELLSIAPDTSGRFIRVKKVL